MNRMKRTIGVLSLAVGMSALPSFASARENSPELLSITCTSRERSEAVYWNYTLYADRETAPHGTRLSSDRLIVEALKIDQGGIFRQGDRPTVRDEFSASWYDNAKRTLFQEGDATKGMRVYFEGLIISRNDGKDIAPGKKEITYPSLCVRKWDYSTLN